MDFQASEQWLESLQLFGIKLGLEQTRQLADLCGSPDRGLQFIHLAGTNGKGSIGAMLERALRENGKRTGFYSSPHLISVCERIRINGQAVSEDEFAFAASQVRLAVEQIKKAGGSPTYFEVMTVMAMLIFARAKCDLVVWETGMGGRLDATNIVTPEVSVITNIAMDHERYLGNTLAAIAGEKAGIIKPGIPVVCGDLPAEALAVIREKAAEKNAALILSAERFPLLDNDPESLLKPDLQRFRCGERLVTLALNGMMQRRNVQVTLSVLSVLGMDTPAALAGLAQTRWPGRIELCAENRVIVDGGHNPDGLHALTESLRRLYPGKRFCWVFGAFADKDFTGGLQEIAPLAKSLEAVGFAEGSRLSASPEEIIRQCEKLGISCVKTMRSLTEILHEICKEAVPETPVIVAGSLYLAGEALSILEMPEKVLNL